MDKLGCITTCGIAPAYLTSLTQYDVQQAAIHVSTLTDVASWLIADLLVWAHSKAADDFEVQALYRKVLHMTGHGDMSKWKADNMRRVGQRIPWDLRRHTDILTFGHHALLVGHSKRSINHWLDKAEANNWSVQSLREALSYDDQGSTNQATRGGARGGA